MLSQWYFYSETCFPRTVELQWLEQPWDHEYWFQSKVVLASVNFYIYKLNFRDSISINGASVVKVFMLLFSFSILVTRRSLK